MTVHRLLGATLLALALSSPASSQTWTSTSLRARGPAFRPAPGGFSWSVLESIGYESHVTRHDPAGQALFSRSRRFATDGNYLTDVAPFPDGTAWAFGSGRFAAERFDSTGQSLETITVTLDKYSATLHDMIPTASGGLVLVGHGLDEAEQEFAGVIARYLPDGSLHWVKSFVDPSFTSSPTEFQDVVELADGSLVVAGMHEGEPLIMRFASDGSPMWTRLLEDDGGYPYLPASIEVAPDGSPLASWTLVGDGNIWTVLVKFDVTGNLLWAREADAFFPYDAAVTQGGAWLLAGFGPGEGPSSGSVLLELDALTGALVRARTWDVPGNDWFVGVDTDPLGILLAGDTWLPAEGKRAVTLFRLDDAGEGAACSGIEIVVELTDAAPALLPPANMVEGTASCVRRPSGLPETDSEIAFQSGCYGSLGVPFCSPGQANSTGSPGTMLVRGSDVAVLDLVRLRGANLPPQQLGYFLVGRGTGIVQPPGSQGDFCLDGMAVGRWQDEVKSTGAAGKIGLKIDLTALPGLGAVQPGDTWGFQMWHRDVNPGPTSNFTDTVRVTFR